MILLVGVSVRALMESAAESGYEAMGIDYFGDIDACRQGKTMNLTVDYGVRPTVKNLLEVAKNVSCRSLIYASGPENAPEQLDYWEERGLLKGNGVSVLRKVRNPRELRRSLGQVGAKMPGFCSVKEWRYPPNRKRWLLKPLNRGGGHGILALPEEKEDANRLISALPDPTQYIIQEFMSGIPGSVSFLANGQKAVVLGTSRQLIGSRGKERPFLYEGNIVPLDLRGMMNPKDFEKEITKMVQHITKDFGLKGINTLDFIVNRDGIWVLEVNPRWSASVELIEKALGERLFACHLAACNGADLEGMTDLLKRIQTANTHTFWGKRVVYAPESGVIVQCDGNQLEYLYRQGVRDIPRKDTKIEKGQPICSVLTSGATDRHCELRLGVKAKWAGQFFGQCGVMAVAR
ncbi:MAG: ATP-grasp domain-containing protein [Peptococcaceae bacterium]|nr:ATP-grasp domain-containing protein [Peptococcaceae bacterium]